MSTPFIRSSATNTHSTTCLKTSKTKSHMDASLTKSFKTSFFTFHIPYFFNTSSFKPTNSTHNSSRRQTLCSPLSQTPPHKTSTSITTTKTKKSTHTHTHTHRHNNISESPRRKSKTSYITYINIRAYTFNSTIRPIMPHFLLSSYTMVIRSKTSNYIIYITSLTNKTFCKPVKTFMKRRHILCCFCIPFCYISIYIKTRTCFNEFRCWFMFFICRPININVFNNVSFFFWITKNIKTSTSCRWINPT